MNTTIKKRQEDKILVARYKKKGKKGIIEGTPDFPLVDTQVESKRLSKTPDEII